EVQSYQGYFRGQSGSRGVLYSQVHLHSCELTKSKRFDGSADQTPKSVNARKLVVLAAGTLSTPMILQRSGIGESTRLQELHVKNIISNLPGVGRNLWDHPHFRTPSAFMDVSADDTSDVIMQATPEILESLLQDFKTKNGGLLS